MELNPFYELGLQPDIVLARGKFRPDAGGRFDARIHLRTHPTCGLELDCTDQGTSDVMRLDGIEPKRGTMDGVDGVSFILDRWSTSFSHAVGDVTGCAKLLLQPDGGDLTRRIDEKVGCAFFFVVNGPKFHKGYPMCQVNNDGAMSFFHNNEERSPKSNGWHTDCLRLEYEGWIIKISATRDARDNRPKAKEAEGVFASHCGEIRLASGRDFTLSEVRQTKIMYRLFRFLSFIRGAHCGIPVLLGGIDVMASPMIACNSKSRKYNGTEGWYDELKVKKCCLKSMFSVFSEKLEHEQKFADMVAAYIEINSTSEAVLEMRTSMSFSVINVGREANVIGSAIKYVWPGFREKSAVDFGAWNSLRILKNRSKWKDGAAFAEDLWNVRHNLAHGLDFLNDARSKTPQPVNLGDDDLALLGVHNFLLHLQELTILKKLGYSGFCKLRHFSNEGKARLPVPWLKSDTDNGISSCITCK